MFNVSVVDVKYEFQNSRQSQFTLLIQN